MSNLKKRVPIDLLEAMQPLIDNNKILLKPIFTEGYYFHLTDLDSDLFFKVFEKDDIYIVERKPFSSISNKLSSVGLRRMNEVIANFQDWISILKRYEMNSIFDDPFIKSYTEEFYESIKMVDEDADEKPFDHVKQQYLLVYLENAKLILESHKTESNKEVIDSIIEDCESLENELTQLPKNKVLEKLSTIWAKSKKEGWKLAKDLLTKFKEETISTVVKHVLENANPESIWNFIQSNLLNSVNP